MVVVKHECANALQLAGYGSNERVEIPAAVAAQRNSDDDDEDVVDDDDDEARGGLPLLTREGTATATSAEGTTSLAAC